MAKHKSGARRESEQFPSRTLADFTARAQRADRKAWALIEAIDELAADEAARDLDGPSDMTQLEQMRLQHHLESMTKAFEALSNVMKKVSRSSDAIIQKLK